MTAFLVMAYRIEAGPSVGLVMAVGTRLGVVIDKGGAEVE